MTCLTRNLLFIAVLLCFYVSGVPEEQVSTSLKPFCPEKCSCEKTIVHCFKSYNIPKILKNTTELYMNNNFLGPHINRTLGELPAMWKLDLSGNNIHWLEPDFLAGSIELKEVDLSKNSIETLPDDIFSSNSDLEILDLSSNKFYILPEKSIRFLVKLKKLDLSHNNLISPFLGIRFQVLVKLSVLNLSHNNFKTVPENSFDVIRKWDGNIRKHIDMSYSKIETVEANALTGIRGLHKFCFAGNDQMKSENLTSALSQIQNSGIQELDISYSGIMDVKEALGNFTETGLKFLNISHNSITKITNNSLVYLVSLERIDASWNHLSTLAGGLDDLENLVHLDVSFNRIKTVKRAQVVRLSKLNSLDLSNNRIVNIFEGTFSPLPRISTLDMSDNKIERFDLSSTISSSLRKLSLAGNKLISIGASVNLPKIRHLDLSRNKLKDLEAFLLRSCKNIVSVNFSRNHITKINHQVFKPFIPKVIDLSFNYLYSVKNFNWLEASEIYLQGNLIKTIDYQGFFAMNRLSYLDLSQNQIQTIDKDTFNYLTNVTTLLLKGNQLTFNPNEASLFRFMTRLQHLDLSDNHISKLRALMFSRCEKLKYLSLASNKFSSFDPKVVSGVPTLLKLHLENNPFHCSCDLLDFRSWLNQVDKSPIPLVDKNLRCQSPKQRKEILIKDFTLKDFECNRFFIYLVVGCSLVGLFLLVCLIATLLCHFYKKWVKNRSLPDDDETYQYETMATDNKYHHSNSRHNHVDILSPSILKDAQCNGYIGYPQKDRDIELKPITKLKSKLKKKKQPKVRRSNSVTFGFPISRTADYILNMENADSSRQHIPSESRRIRRSRSLDLRGVPEPIYAQPVKRNRSNLIELPPTYGDHQRRHFHEENVFPRYPPMRHFRRQSTNSYGINYGMPFSYNVDPRVLDSYGTSRRRPPNPALGDYLDLPLVTYRRRNSNTPPRQSATLPRNMGRFRSNPQLTGSAGVPRIPYPNGRIPSQELHRTVSHGKIEWV